MRKLIYRVFVEEFYRLYSGLFMLIVLLFAGMCPPGQHWNVFVNLASASISKGWLLVLVVALFTLYLFLVISLIQSQFHRRVYRFLLYSLGAYSRRLQNIRWWLILLINSLPILFFGVTAIIVGFINGEYYYAILFSFYIIIAFIISFLLVRKIAEPMYSHDRFFLKLNFGSNGYTSLGLRYLITSQRLPFLIAKVLSYAFINILFFVYSDVKEHVGVVMLILTSVVLGHSTVIAGQFVFDREALSLLRNLPVNKYIRGAKVALRLLIILLPEIGWLLFHYPPSETILFLCYMWTFALFLYHMFFVLPKEEEYGKWFFFLFFIIAITSPLGMIIPMICILLLVSLFIFRYFD